MTIGLRTLFRSPMLFRKIHGLSNEKFTAPHHLHRANVVVDALSRKSKAEDSSAYSSEMGSLLNSMRRLLIGDHSEEIILNSIQEFVPLDLEELKSRQRKDRKLMEVISRVEKSKGLKDFKVREDGTLYFTKIGE